MVSLKREREVDLDDDDDNEDGGKYVPQTYALRLVSS